MPSKPRICERCEKPIPQRSPQVLCWGKRWHRDCWPSEGGRPALGPGRGAESRVVSTRISGAQGERLDVECAARGIKPSALLAELLAPIVGEP